jgi:hypothetical protein
VSLTNRSSGRAGNDTVEVDPEMDATVTIHGRDFQKYAIENDIQYMPVDEVWRSD